MISARLRTLLTTSLLCLATTIAAPAQVLTTLAVFDGSDGAHPDGMPLAQGRDGRFYGTTFTGGRSGNGVVYRVSSKGNLIPLYKFNGGNDGDIPNGVILATDGNFYGITSEVGTVFKLTPTGTKTTLHIFCLQQNCPDGETPTALTQASNGNFYGTTTMGGTKSTFGGTVFEITPSGNLTTLYSFCALSNCADGETPWAGVVEANDGNFYGTTYAGGTYGYGTVFKITPQGTLSTLYSFCAQVGCPDGQNPSAPLLQASNGRFYGMTSQGGANNGGTIFAISPAGEFSTIYIFCSQPNCADGSNPNAGLVEATDGNLYGVTPYGGDRNYGTLFKITPAGSLTRLHNFCSIPKCADGTGSNGLVQATDGNFYAATSDGGGDYHGCPGIGCGTVFSFDVSLGPFVAFVKAVGRIGNTAQILGQGFTGTTNVSFNGAPADFSVRADTFLIATVPAGATTGYVTVTTPTGTLTSNKPFQVIP